MIDLLNTLLLPPFLFILFMAVSSWLVATPAKAKARVLPQKPQNSYQSIKHALSEAYDPSESYLAHIF